MIEKYKDFLALIWILLMHLYILLIIHNIIDKDILGTFSMGIIFLSQCVFGPPGFPSPLLSLFKKEDL